MAEHFDFDSITIESLRAVGGFKWSAYPDAIGAFVAEMDFGVAPPVREALIDAVDKGLFGYLPAAVSEAMSAATADWYATSYGWKIDAASVHPVADVIKVMEIAITELSAPGSKVVLPTPAYMPFVSLPPLLGREVVEVPLLRDGEDWLLDLEGIGRAFDDGGGLLILCNPYNPVGKVFARSELEALADVVEQHGARVFSDEIHAPLIYNGNIHVPYASVSEAAAQHTITAASASKAWNLPGLKCAQAILTGDADKERWKTIGPMAEHGASNLGVIANTAAYTRGRPWLDDVVGYLDENRMHLVSLLADLIPDIEYYPPQGTYLAWLDCRELGLGDRPAEFFLAKAGVALVDGTLCGEAGRGFARLNLATPRPILEQAIDRMARALKDR